MKKTEIIKWLTETDKTALSTLYKKACSVRKEYLGNKVYLRGLLEISNVCSKNCYYCGIRRSNKKFKRYSMALPEIIKSSKEAYERGFGSVVIQSGERRDSGFIDFIDEAVRSIKKISKNNLRITLCSGEQSKATLKRWFDSGAERYLLRIETSNKKLYKKLHPADHSFEERLKCLKDIKQIGYQTGTGVLIGVPGQTPEDLHKDLIFMKRYDIDMIGMGPYLISENTPLAKKIKFNPEKNLELGLKMIALARILLKNVNIAATTALEALNPNGWLLGIKAGANVVMPNITPKKYRGEYLLYQNKPCLNIDTLAPFEKKVLSLGCKIAYNEFGDSLHFCN